MRLTKRTIPFVLHSAYNEYGPACGGGIVVPKPAHPDELIAAVATLLKLGPARDQADVTLVLMEIAVGQNESVQG